MRWRTVTYGRGSEGEMANGVGSQYPSHHIGTWCIQHYYRWFKRTRTFRWNKKSGFCACAITFQLASTLLYQRVYRREQLIRQMNMGAPVNTSRHSYLHSGVTGQINGAGYGWCMCCPVRDMDGVCAVRTKVKSSVVSQNSHQTFVNPLALASHEAHVSGGYKRDHYTSCSTASNDFIFQARSQNCEKRLLTSSCLSVRLPARNNSAPNGRIFMKFGIWILLENLSRKFKFH